MHSTVMSPPRPSENLHPAGGSDLSVPLTCSALRSWSCFGCLFFVLVLIRCKCFASFPEDSSAGAPHPKLACIEVFWNARRYPDSVGRLRRLRLTPATTLS